MHFQFGDKQQIQDAVAVVVSVNNYCATGWRTGDEIPVLHKKFATIGHVNGEWLKRLGLKSFLEFLNCHILM